MKTRKCNILCTTKTGHIQINLKIKLIYMANISTKFHQAMEITAWKLLMHAPVGRKFSPNLTKNIPYV